MLLDKIILLENGGEAQRKRGTKAQSEYKGQRQ